MRVQGAAVPGDAEVRPRLSEQVRGEGLVVAADAQKQGVVHAAGQRPRLLMEKGER